MQRALYFLLAVSFVTLISSCGDLVESVEVGPYTEAEYSLLREKLNLPENYYNYSTSPFPGNVGLRQQNALATLGRVLFYDVNLSKDRTVSCASCHQQALAFSDGLKVSEGIEGRVTTRNSLALGVFSSFSDYTSDPDTRLFWDGRVSQLHEQMKESLESPNEMGMTLDEVVKRVNQEEHYRILTEKAFGTPTMQDWMPFAAMEAFINSINSRNAKIDIAVNNFIDPIKPWPVFDQLENKGKDIFFSNCNTCHEAGPFKSSVTFANNGLDINYADGGVGAITHLNSDLGKFKVPGLRNITLTAPYMHDGRFATLEEVIDFYSEGIQQHDNLHPSLRDANDDAKKFNFSAEDKEALIAFLKTLTDHSMTNEVKWSDPFL